MNWNALTSCRRPAKKGEKFNRVFVHFKRWNNSENSNTARERLLNGKEIKIIYDEPWFWKISAYREATNRRESVPQQQPTNGARKPKIAFDSDEDKSSKPSNRDDRPRPRRDDSRERQRRDDRPRRRDDSRERSRRDDRTQRRRDDSRERPRHDDRYQRRRDDSRERPRREELPVRKFVESSESRTPQSSPPRQRQDEDAVIQTPLDYGNIMPPPKRRQTGGKKPEPNVLKIEKEEGEVCEEKKTENA